MFWMEGKAFRVKCQKAGFLSDLKCRIRSFLSFMGQIRYEIMDNENQESLPECLMTTKEGTMQFGILQMAAFFLFFGVSFYGLTSIKFEKFCKTDNPQKIYVLLFLFSFALAYLCTQAVLLLTVYNGF